MSEPDNEFAFGVWTGCILGFAFAIWITIGFATFAPAGSFEKYQGFIGGLLATVAAGLGAWAVMRQTRHQRQVHQQQRTEALRAQRAALAFSCSEISAYCRECVSILSDIPGHQPERLQLGEVIRFPDPSIRAIDNFTSLAAACDQGTAIAIAHFLWQLQTQRSRLIDVEQALNGAGEIAHVRPHQIDDRIYDALAIMSHLDIFFEYTDFETNTVTKELSLERLRSQVTLNRLHDARFDELRGMIQRRHPDHNFAW
jgi:hypothetical protein